MRKGGMVDRAALLAFSKHLGQVDKELQRFWIAHRIQIGGLFGGEAHQDLAHGHFHLFPAQGQGYLLDGVDLVRNVAGRNVLPDPNSDPLLEAIVQAHPLAKDHEQRHERLLAQCLQVDNQAIHDLGYPLDGLVDLAGTHADAVALDGRVGAPIDDTATAPVESDPVSMPPDAGVHLKVAGLVAAVAGIVPEEQGHGGHRLCDDEFTKLVHDALPDLIERFHPGAQIAALDLASMYRQQPAGQPPTNGVHRSVPPLTDSTARSLCTFS